MKFMTNAIIATALLTGLAACSESQRDIPASAQLMSSGTGQVSYRTPDQGHIYVYDDTWHQMVYSGIVNGDRLVQVDPQQGRVLVDGRTVVEKPLGSGDQFRIWFQPTKGDTVTVERETRIEHRTAQD